jgi:hypothetical protein
MFGALGVILGYSTLWRMADSLKYAAGTILTFSALYIFRNLPFTSGKFFAPSAAAASAIFVGFVFVAERGFQFTDVVLFCTEIILVFASAYFYREALSSSQDSLQESSGRAGDAATVKAVSFFVLAATILISLGNVRLIANISAGKLAAVVFVMCAAFKGGFGMGSAAGVSMGIAFDIAGGGGFYSMAYGFSGLIAGVTGRTRRLAAAAAFVLTKRSSGSIFSGSSMKITEPAKASYSDAVFKPLTLSTKTTTAFVSTKAAAAVSLRVLPVTPAIRPENP